MKIHLFLIAIFLQTAVAGQSSEGTDRFTFEVARATGDLNKDNVPDVVIVTQDTLTEKAPYRLQVFFGEPAGKYRLVVSSAKLIEAEYPDGRQGYRTGNGFVDIIIKNGVLSVNNELLRGHYEHKFRFQNGNFELIGFSQVYSDGQGTMTTTDFNLSTGIRLEKTERYDTDKVISDSKKKIWIRPLPKLQDFVPFENELY